MVAGIHDIPAGDWMTSQRNSAFLGDRMLQRWCDLVVWEQLLDHNPQLKSVIELGTYNGAFSTYLFMQCCARGMQFETIDNNPGIIIASNALRAIAKLGAKFITADVWDGHTVKYLIDSMPHPLVLFCDDGDKPREFRTFGPLLTKGDIIATHDWTEEFGPDDALPIAHMTEPYLHEECEEIGSITRFWKIK